MTKLMIGCNYHTRWQRHPAMRFVLSSVNGDMVELKTRNTGAKFETHVKNLIFIDTPYNIRKYKRLLEFEVSNDKTND